MTGMEAEGNCARETPQDDRTNGHGDRKRGLFDQRDRLPSIACNSATATVTDASVIGLPFDLTNSLARFQLPKCLAASRKSAPFVVIR